jgi:hypothetical protein
LEAPEFTLQQLCDGEGYVFTPGAGDDLDAQGQAFR